MIGNPRPVRVLRVIARLNIGGPARHVTILDRGLRTRGFDTLLAYGEIGRGEGDFEGLASDAAVPRTRIPGLGRRLSVASDLRAFAALLRLVFAFRPDVVHTHTAKAGTLGRVAAWLYNATRSRSRRTVILHTFHGHVFHGYFGPLGSALVRWWERGMARISDGILVLSPQQRDEIGTRFRIAAPTAVHVVPLGLELGDLMALAAGRRARPEEFVYGYVGRFAPVKNVLLLLAAFGRVHEERPHTRLVMVGDGETMVDARAFVAEGRLEAAVEFPGWRRDLAGVYGAIDALVLSSVNEGTPVSVIEAMAAALPVVATAVGGVPDVVTHGETGLLVDSGSVESLATAMRQLADSPAECTRLGLAARESVRARFGAERLVSDVAAVYAAALCRKRTGARVKPA
jgi:glycosyltransferase involved in cell wall biosynthesis